MIGTDEPALLAALGELLDGDVTRLARVSGGGNNELFRIESDGRPLAVKRYQISPADPRDRLGHEYTALSFLTRSGESAVPKPVAIDRRARIAIYEWIEAQPVVHFDDADLDASLAFLARLADYRKLPAAIELPMASEACCAGSDLHQQIQVRLERLLALSPAEPSLMAFLRDTFVPVWESFATQSAHEPVGLAERTLSPSDFGRHNMLRRPDGSLIFLDFEYFGWDDPVKLVADTVWHPGSQMSSAEGAHFIAGATRIFGGDPSYARRFAQRLPVFGLRWALIVLAEFIPEHWERRRIAGQALSWATAKSRQLEKAERFVARSKALRA